MTNTINYTNKAKESVLVEYEPISGNMFSDKGRCKTLIRKVVINGIFIHGAAYTPAKTEPEIKKTVASIRRNRIGRLKQKN